MIFYYQSDGEFLRGFVVVFLFALVVLCFAFWGVNAPNDKSKKSVDNNKNCRLYCSNPPADWEVR